MDRAQEFIRTFNQVQNFLSQLVNSDKYLPFSRLVDDVSKLSPAVKAKSGELKQFAKLRNAIVHDSEYPPHVIAIPSQEALQRFTHLAEMILRPDLLIPTFEAIVHCFLPTDHLAAALLFMRANDFSQVVVRDGPGQLVMLTVEGVTRWFANSLNDPRSSIDRTTVGTVIAGEPPGCFKIMRHDNTTFEAADAFKNSIHRQATRLYAIIVTRDGGAGDDPIGLVTPWDLVHNPRLKKEMD